MKFNKLLLSVLSAALTFSHCGKKEDDSSNEINGSIGKDADQRIIGEWKVNGAGQVAMTVKIAPNGVMDILCSTTDSTGNYSRIDGKTFIAVGKDSFKVLRAFYSEKQITYNGQKKILQCSLGATNGTYAFDNADAFRIIQSEETGALTYKLTRVSSPTNSPKSPPTKIPSEDPDFNEPTNTYVTPENIYKMLGGVWIDNASSTKYEFSSTVSNTYKSAVKIGAQYGNYSTDRFSLSGSYIYIFNKSWIHTFSENGKKLTLTPADGSPATAKVILTKE